MLTWATSKVSDVSLITAGTFDRISSYFPSSTSSSLFRQRDAKSEKTNETIMIVLQCSMEEIEAASIMDVSANYLQRIRAAGKENVLVRSRCWDLVANAAPVAASMEIINAAAKFRLSLYKCK
jgi:hypothetical protein